MRFTSREKRKATRFSKKHPVKVQAATPSGMQWVPAEVLDVSVGGVAVKTAARLQVGTETRIDFSSDSDLNPIRVTVVVRNQRGEVYGLKYEPRSLTECKSLDWIDGLLLASGFDVHCPPAPRQPRSRFFRLASLAAGVALGAFLGSLFGHGFAGPSIGSATGLLLSYSASTL